MPALLMNGCSEEMDLRKKKKREKEQGKENPLEGLMIVKKLGEGHMSRVFLAVEKESTKAWAVKVKEKEVLQRDKEAMKMACVEKDILATLDHPFLPSLFTHFESDNHTFLAMEFCSGGDINVFRKAQPNRIFSVSALRFYAAEVVLALEHLHGKGIVYRDLKPENILVRQSGHIMLTDFDLSVRLPQRQVMARAHTIVGTEEYMAPEVLWCRGHAYPVDWWSLGILMYEMAYGKTPFGGASRKETFYNIMCMDLRIPTVSASDSESDSDCCSHSNSISSECSNDFGALNDLIQKLLVKDPSSRLGSVSGARDVKGHPFFQGLCWDALQYVCRPPFVPSASPSASIIVRLIRPVHFPISKVLLQC